MNIKNEQFLKKVDQFNLWDYRKIVHQFITKNYFSFEKHAFTKYNSKYMFDQKICAITG